MIVGRSSLYSLLVCTDGELIGGPERSVLNHPIGGGAEKLPGVRYDQ